MIIKILDVVRYPYCMFGVCVVNMIIDVQKVDPIPPIEKGFVLIVGGLKEQLREFDIYFREIKHIVTSYMTFGHKLRVFAGVKIGPLYIVTDYKEVTLS